jgi:hypothetical protein
LEVLFIFVRISRNLLSFTASRFCRHSNEMRTVLLLLLLGWNDSCTAQFTPFTRNSRIKLKNQTSLLTSFRFYITYPQQDFMKRSSPKIAEWSHLIPTQKCRESRGLHCLSVRYHQSICMPQLKWPMKTAFLITNRWVWFHWIRARNYPETRNVHCLRLDSQQWIVLLRFKWYFRSATGVVREMGVL